MRISPLEAEISWAWPLECWTDVTVLAAVSGGPDSVAMLRALARLRLPEAAGRIVVAHFNHRWRGEESDRDEAFVRSLAAELHLAIEIDHATDIAYSEEAARDQRYQFLTATAHRLGARYVALGHTADDQAETILFRLLRGTGLSGLAGMPQTRPLSDAATLVRPLFRTRRATVLDYLQSLGQPYRIDSSNQDNRFSRNRLRHEVLPKLAEFTSGDVVEQLVSLGHQAGEVYQPIREEASRLLDEVLELRGNQAVLHLNRFSGLPPRHLLREMFVELWRRRAWPRGEMTFARWDELADMAAGQGSGAVTLPGAIEVRLCDHTLVIAKLVREHTNPLPRNLLR